MIRRTIGPYTIGARSQNTFCLKATPGEHVPTQILVSAGGQSILIEDVESAKDSHFASLGAVNSLLFDRLPLWLRSLCGYYDLIFKLWNPHHVDLRVSVDVDFAMPGEQARRATLLCPFLPIEKRESSEKTWISKPFCGGRLRQLRMMTDCSKELGRSLKVMVAVYDAERKSGKEISGTRDVYELRATPDGHLFGPTALVRSGGVIELTIDDDFFKRDVKPSDFMVVMDFDRHL